MKTEKDWIKWAIETMQQDVEDLSPTEMDTLQDEIQDFLGNRTLTADDFGNMERVSPFLSAPQKMKWDLKEIRSTFALACMVLGSLCRGTSHGLFRVKLRVDASEGDETGDIATFTTRPSDVGKVESGFFVGPMEGVIIESPLTGPLNLIPVAKGLWIPFCLRLVCFLVYIGVDHIRTCPAHQETRYFFAEHGRQRFCGPRCQNKTKQARHYARHPEEHRKRAREDMRNRRDVGKGKQQAGSLRKSGRARKADRKTIESA